MPATTRDNTAFPIITLPEAKSRVRDRDTGASRGDEPIGPAVETLTVRSSTTKSCAFPQHNSFRTLRDGALFFAARPFREMSAGQFALRDPSARFSPPLQAAFGIMGVARGRPRAPGIVRPNGNGRSASSLVRGTPRLPHGQSSVAPHQGGPQGVPLDIAAHHEEMLVRLHGERLEPTLIEMTGAGRSVVCMHATAGCASW